MPKTIVKANTSVDEALEAHVITRYRTVLRKAGIKTVRLLTQQTELQLSEIKGIGNGVVEQIRDFYNENDLKFDMSDEDWKDYDPEFEADPNYDDPPEQQPALVETVAEPQRLDKLRSYAGMKAVVADGHSSDSVYASLIDGVVSVCWVLRDHNLDLPETKKALQDLREDSAVKYIIGR